MNRKYIDSLTGVRGIFILFIVLSHNLPRSPLVQSIPMVPFVTIFGGHIGNSMFFMLSGYLMALAYKNRIQSGSLAFRDFLTRRLQKLYPMYIITNIIMFLYQLAEFGPSAISLRRIAFTILLQAGCGLHNEFPYHGPTWFVTAVFVCYIVYYFLTYHAKNTTQYHCFIVLGLIIGYALNTMELTLPYCSNENGRAFMNFFIGCLLFEILPQLSQDIRKWLQPVGFASLLAALYLMKTYGVDIISGSLQVALAFFLNPIVLLLATGNGICAKFLASKPVVALGTVSVAIYFWHMPVYDAFRLTLLSLFRISDLPDLVFVVYMVVMLLFSTIIYNFFHKKNLV